MGKGEWKRSEGVWLGGGEVGVFTAECGEEGTLEEVEGGGRGWRGGGEVIVLVKESE